MRILPLLLLSLFSPAAALAHPHPRFWVMDDLTNGSSVGADVILGDLDNPTDTKVLLIEPELYFSVAYNVKLFLEIPVGIAFWEEPVTNDDQSSGLLGNLAFGALFLSSSGGHGRGNQVVFGGGLNFSGLTASDEDEEAFAAGQAATFFFLRDLGKYRPNTNTLRLHGDLRFATDRVFLQAELGLHLYLDEDDAPIIFNDDDVTVLRIIIGAGVLVTRDLSIIAEFTNTSFAFEDDDADELFHVIDVGVRHDSGDTTFSVRLIAPLDDGGFTEAVGAGLDIYQRF